MTYNRTNPRQKPLSPPPTGNNFSVHQIIGFMARFRRFLRDFSGIVVFAFALMTFLSMLAPSLTSGMLLNAWRGFLNRWLGWGSIFIPVGLGVAGLAILRRPASPGILPDEQHNRSENLPWMRIFVLELGIFILLALLAALGGNSLARAEAGMDGGRVGWGLAELARAASAGIGLGSHFWQIVVFSGVLLLCLVYGLGLSNILARLLQLLKKSPSVQPMVDEPAVSVASDEASQGSSLAKTQRRQSALPAEFRKRFRMPSPEEKIGPPSPRDERLPPLEILSSDQGSRPDERNINLTAGLIEKTLSEFGIPAKVIGFKVGPTVTQFAIEPGFLDKPTTSEEDVVKQKVRVSQIASLRRDLALALSAERLRIEAPVPGRPYIGIEVPNVRTAIVRLRPILETETFYRVASPLAIALGRDVSGQPVIADLTSMPHLLIAGTTGSGKSVCIAALTTCLVMNNSPKDLRLVMVDPKMVELVRFNGLPHLYGKVETDLERINGVLRWVVVEMDQRYKLLEQMHARHIDSYNRKVSRRKGMEPLPRIVVMVDELADLMMTAPEQTEHTLVRLAQMARATGIHLVVATQRPSTEVVTGLIKANFPARISFAVASAVDSRVILDATGAETLLGHGDMLFIPPEASSPLRCQGVMVSDQEVERVISYWQQQASEPDEKAAQPPWEELLAEEEVLADRDNLIKKAIALVRETQKASTSLLQRRLRIGYPRAARLMDELEELGVVGPSQGGGREREVIISPDDEMPDLNV
jgi:S-DNA-T family DNA segregation ATPase FtsK/SpoIIIE